MKKIKWIVVFFMAFLLLVACSAKKEALGKEDSGKEIDLTVGEKILVTLDSNPTTGFVWEVDTLDESVISQVGEAKYEADNADATEVGSGGKDTFTFEAVGAGETTLKLIYHQPWDEETPPVDVFSVKITVK